MSYVSSQDREGVSLSGRRDYDIGKARLMSGAPCNIYDLARDRCRPQIEWKDPSAIKMLDAVPPVP